MGRTQKIIELMGSLAPVEGYNLTALDDVRFLRSNRPLHRVPVLYDPGIVIVCQGCKRGYLGEDIYLYDAQHYLVVSVPVPFTMETEATEEEPMLAVYLRLDFTLAADLIVALDDFQGLVEAKPRGMYSSPMDEKLSESLLRFLEVMSVPMDAQILGPTLMREIYYRIITSEQGGSMRAALNRQGQFGKVARAIRKIHGCYHQHLDVEALAAEAMMSMPSFHAHFRTVTDTSPMQYLKSTRLHQARLLMLRNDITAATACAKVGYESASQFSREFKRFFGRTPREEIQWMKRTYALPVPASASIYVSSH
ncbi:AraC family transcriptional regulator N-terminal domain-containing protein [Pseudomonas antarctica]|uniref:AraC-type DNA-binding protein n=1 Tax=Pseudomonas antarctica TaxID=219572 RepID=A0A1H0AA62_9PSED|nr:AraC family transcriptional regulator [Pseudomonas antarctica]KAF2407196.1 RCS-specific HTH-type transcriptional activator RclR [Pseudomonas antarctica]SDN30460.1 AraC-type DNA-binding protein [Pseudomonas antarctica]